MARDPGCVAKTVSEEHYESREQVMAAEAEREASAFSSRLERWRTDEENRHRLRAQTSSVAPSTTETSTTGPEATLPPSTDAAPGIGSEMGPEASLAQDDRFADDLDRKDASTDSFGSSIRALTPAVPPEPKGPTPVSFLEGAKCLLTSDLIRIKEVVKAEQSGSRKRKKLGELALAIVEAQTLVDAIDAELTNRRIPQGVLALECREKDTSSMVEALRGLVGPPVVKAAAAPAYGRGLARLRRKLQEKAGLTLESPSNP